MIIELQRKYRVAIPEELVRKLGLQEGDMRGKICIGEQPTFDTADEMFAELDRCDT